MRYQTFKQLSICIVTFGFLLVLSSPQAAAQDEAAELRDEVNELRAIIEQQRQQLDRQSEALQQLGSRLEDVEANSAADVPKNSDAGAPAAAKADRAGRDFRDSVGDLNSDAVKAGDFAGAIRLPNTRDVQLAIGGFIKTAALWDSNAENIGVDFLPALLERRDNQDGNFALDSTLTRWFFDARAPSPGDGQLRGYMEWDLNGKNDGELDVKTRLAYGSWSTSAGTLTVGQNWSTFMDLKLLPEGLTEPTVSGAIFVRQSQIQWSAPLGAKWTYHVAIEDSSSNDFDSDIPDIDRNTELPDVVAGIEYNDSQWHWRLNGIGRKLQLDIPDGPDESATGWGLSTSVRYNFSEGDWLGASASYGEGLGRYLLGIRSTAGGAIEGPDSDLELRDNWGAFVNYFHKWSGTMRSSVTLGHARSDALDFQPDMTFESTSYGAVNYLWSPLPYLTLGVEYQYGKLEYVNGDDLDNSRISFALQIY